MNGGGIIIISGRKANGDPCTPNTVTVTVAQAFYDWAEGKSPPPAVTAFLTALNNALACASS